eukprot:437049_1
MSACDKLLFEHFLKPEALFTTNDGLLIAQPDVSRQQYYTIEYDNNENDSCDHNYNKPQPKYQQRNSTANINTSLISSLYNDNDSNDSNDSYSTSTDSSDIDDDDDDDDVDWKCCGHNISFLNEYSDDLKLIDIDIDKDKYFKKRNKNPMNYNNNINNTNKNGLDAFLSDVLEETYHKKK